MDLNKKILKLGLIFVGIVMIMSLGFALYIKIDNPVFLKSYIEESVSVDEEYYYPVELQIRFITNVYDKRQIDYIEFLDKDNGSPSLLGGRIYDRIESFGLYNINTTNIEIVKNDIEKNFDWLELNKARVTYNDGEVMEVDLGKIILYERNYDSDYLEGRSSSSSSDGTSTSIANLKEDIRLKKLESPLFEETKSLCHIKIDGKDYRDISGSLYKKGDSLRVDSIFKIPDDILSRYTHFELQPRLYFEDSQGKESYVNIYNIRYIPYHYKFWEIFNYLKLRGSI